MNNLSNSDNHIESQDKALFDRIAYKYAQKDIVESTMIARRYQLFYAVNPIFERIKSIGTIIEIACGVGASAGYLRGRYENYLGIDHSEKMIEAARSFNRDFPKAEFVSGNIKMADLGDRKADLVLAAGALHHMTDINQVMDSLKRIAGPRAYFIAIEPQCGNPFVQFARWIRAKTDKNYSEKQRYFTRKELNNLMSDNGMTDIEIKYQGYFSPPFAQVILVPSFIIIPLTRIMVWLDVLCDKCLPDFLKSLSWNLVIRARFP